MHSQRINETPSNAWIKTSEDGVVNCAHCDCMAGLEVHMWEPFCSMLSQQDEIKVVQMNHACGVYHQVLIKFHMLELQILILQHQNQLFHKQKRCAYKQ